MSECSFGAEISEDRKLASIVRAWRPVGGQVTVQVVWRKRPQAAVRALSKLYELEDPVAVVIDPQSQAGTLLKPLTESGVLVRKVTTHEVAVAHGEFMDLVDDGGLWHRDQEELTAAVRAAQQRPLAGANAWERKLPVDQSPLVAATLAVFGFLRWEELATPGAWVL